MANINRVKLEKDATPKAFTFTAGVTAGQTYDYTGVDENTIVVFNNTGSAGTAQIMAGNGIQGVVDYTATVPAGFSFMQLNSGEFKNVSGTNKGCVVIKPSATTITVALLETL